jgi:hypothetical protein
MPSAIEGLTPRLQLRVTVTACNMDEWSMIEPAEPGGDPSFHSTADLSRPDELKPILVDMALVRNLFMEIRDPSDALQFYRMTLFPVELSFSEILYYQKLIECASKIPCFKWGTLRQRFDNEDIDELMDAPKAIVSWSKRGVPILECDAMWLADSGPSSAFGALLQLEQLCGSCQRICQRRGCHKSIREWRRSDCRYCCKTCANLARREELKGWLRLEYPA